MSPRKKHESAPPVSGADRIGALPDSILHHLLSFLPAQAAVRTCLLARRWRHLWRSSTGLRIVGLDGPGHAKALRLFVEHLIVLRERTDLETVEIKFNRFEDDDEPYLKLWTRFAVMCKVRALTLHVGVRDPSYLSLDDPPLVSRHLRTLDLHGVCSEEDFFDFAGCPALEDLKIDFCDISVRKISSHSLKHLSITDSHSESGHQLHVSTPSLVSLKLDDFSGPTPFLENMPLLETACVYLGDECRDECLNYDDSGVFCGANDNACENCNRNNDDCSNSPVLLGGISSAKHLELTSESRMFTFARDLKHCPTFSKLKTLLLNEYWCEAPDLDPLACILKNSPVLEKLTLQLFSKGSNHKVEMKGSYSSTERSSAISEHLNIVEVKCNVVDEKILKVLKFLCSFNIHMSSSLPLWAKLFGSQFACDCSSCSWKVLTVFITFLQNLKYTTILSFLYRIQFRVRVRRCGLSVDLPSLDYSDMQGLILYAATMCPSFFAGAYYANSTQEERCRVRSI